MQYAGRGRPPKIAQAQAPEPRAPRCWLYAFEPNRPLPTWEGITVGMVLLAGAAPLKVFYVETGAPITHSPFLQKH